MANKVLLVSPYSAIKVGGIGTWTKNILDYCQYTEFNDICFVNTAFKFKTNLIKNNTTRIFTGVFDSLFLLYCFLFRLIKDHPATIHYTSSASFSLYKDYLAIKIAKIFGRRFVIHWRFGRIPELYELKNTEWQLLCRVIKKSDVSIVLDQKSYQVLLSCGFENIVCLPNPVSLALQQHAESIQNKAKNIKLGKIVFVGHITRMKGVYELVKSCTLLESVTELVLIGPVLENVQKELISISKKRDCGKWLKWRGEIKREKVFDDLIDANAICLPSYTEGFPNVILEAMANKCPVIASNVGAIPEMIVPGTENSCGICIPIGNISALCKAIETIIKDQKLAIKMGENGICRVLDNYTLEIVFNEYRKLWQLS